MINLDPPGLAGGGVVDGFAAVVGAGGWEPGVQMPFEPPDVDCPPGVQISGLVAETPRRPDAVVTRGPYCASNAWSGLESIMISP